MERILLVDDDDSLRRVARKLLEAAGFEVLEASCGDKALAVAETTRCHAALIDVVMPGMSGLETMAALRKTHPSIPIVLMSGYGSIQTAVKAMQLGAYDFLEKPLDKDKLIGVLIGALHQRNGNRAVTYVCRATDIVKTRYYEPGLNIETVASALEISSDHLGRLFTRTTGKSLLDTLHEIRIKEAVGLLTDPAVSIKDIVHRCGYHSHSELDRHFRRAHGCTPRQWRQRFLDSRQGR